MATGPDDPQHDLLRGLEQVRDGLAVVLAARGWSLPAAQVRQALTEVDALRGQCEAAYLHLIRAALATNAGTCEQTGPLSAGALQYHACTAILERVVLDETGKVLEMRSVGRYASRAQRRALAARDQGCAWPGCDIPPQWCDSHHVLWWTRGGQTVIENMVLLCPRHHTEIHAQEWTVTMRDGVPWFTPPAWIDPAPTPIHNGYHQRARQTRQTGQQLRLGHDPPDTG